jgi:hypothetical protein
MGDCVRQPDNGNFKLWELADFLNTFSNLEETRWQTQDSHHLSQWKTVFASFEWGAYLLQL